MMKFKLLMFVFAGMGTLELMAADRIRAVVAAVKSRVVKVATGSGGDKEKEGIRRQFISYGTDDTDQRSVKK